MLDRPRPAGSRSCGIAGAIAFRHGTAREGGSARCLVAVPDYNVCLVEPPGYPHSLGLLELSELVAYSIGDLGYATTLQLNYVDPDARNIIVGCHLLDPAMMDMMPTGTIVLNTEQIYEKAFPWTRDLLAWVQTFETWDYSEANIEQFGKLGIPDVKLLKIGHHPGLTRIQKSPEPDIDVLFYGSIATERRKKILKQIEDSGLKLTTLFGVYSTERDQYIARSKVVLNMHNHASEIFEVVRVNYLLSNAIPVVGEINDRTSITDFYADAIAGVPYGELVDECTRLVNDADARDALGKRGYDAICAHPQTEFTKALLS